MARARLAAILKAGTSAPGRSRAGGRAPKRASVRAALRSQEACGAAARVRRGAEDGVSYHRYPRMGPPGAKSRAARAWPRAPALSNKATAAVKKAVLHARFGSNGSILFLFSSAVAGKASRKSASKLNRLDEAERVRLPCVCRCATLSVSFDGDQGWPYAIICEGFHDEMGLQLRRRQGGGPRRRP